MIRSLSHDAMIVRQQDALAAIDLLVTEIRDCVQVGFASLPLAIPANAAAVLSVSPIVGVIRCAKVAKSVVSRRVIDVVNHGRLLAMREKPSEPVAEVCDALKGDSMIALVVYATSDTASRDVLRGADRPGKHARVRVVVKSIADRLRDALHLASMPYTTRELYHG